MGEVKKFTMVEVSRNNGRNNAPVWIVYRDSVYDVTKYIDQHPGSPDPILEEAGKEATKAFDEIGHSSDARTIMAKYKIGEIVDEEKRFDASGKKRRVVTAPPEETSRGFCSIITCGLVG